MKLKTLLNIMLVCITMPVMANAICHPVVTKYFMGAADVEIIASAAMVSGNHNVCGICRLLEFWT